MLRFVGTVVAILAIDFVLANVNTVDELHWLIWLVASDNTHAHQSLVSNHNTVGHNEQPDDGDRRAVVPHPHLDPLEIGQIRHGLHAALLPNRTRQRAAHTGSTQRNDGKQDQQDHEPDPRITAFVHNGHLVYRGTCRTSICSRRSDVRRVLNIRHDVLDFIGADSLGAHPAISPNVAIHQGLDVRVTGLCCALRVLDPLDQQLLTRTPAVCNARQTRRRHHLIGDLVAGRTIRVEQSLAVFHVTLIPNACRRW